MHKVLDALGIKVADEKVMDSGATASHPIIGWFLVLVARLRALGSRHILDGPSGIYLPFP